MKEKPQSEFESEESSPYVPDNLDRFSTKDKLEADLNYRALSLEAHLEDEMERFKASHDIYGADAEAFQELQKTQQNTRRTFQRSKEKTLDRFDQIIESQKSQDKGLR